MLPNTINYNSVNYKTYIVSRGIDDLVDEIPTCLNYIPLDEIAIFTHIDDDSLKQYDLLFDGDIGYYSYKEDNSVEPNTIYTVRIKPKYIDAFDMDFITYYLIDVLDRYSVIDYKKAPILLMSIDDQHSIVKILKTIVKFKKIFTNVLSQPSQPIEPSQPTE